MNPPHDVDTIAAIATPPGKGGLGVIRISGPESALIGAALFSSKSPRFAGFVPRMLHYGLIRDASGRPLDEVLAAFMPGPHSYTGEDVLEIQGHGGPAALRRILMAVIEAGARPARAGEFTKRAFLNGRLDLSQAEAVAELTGAANAAQADMALARLQGLTGEKARELREILEELRAKICLAVDFPEEDVECLSYEEFSESVGRVIDRVDGLLRAHERARPFREGALAVIFGRVNAGKSSLFNALLGRERAIVTDIPGATRDYLEEGLDLDGLPVRLADTAGLRETADAIERLGLDRSRELAAQADIGLYVVDGAAPFAHDEDPEDVAIARRLGADRVIAVVNKADLSPASPDPFEKCRELGFTPVRVCAKTGQGLDELAGLMRERLTGGPETLAASEAAAAPPSLREAEALKSARRELAALCADIDARIPFDLLSVRLEAACADLAAITGEIIPEGVLESLFASFCIGK